MTSCCPKHTALKALLDAISFFKGHGMPGFVDRAVAYIVLHDAKEALKYPCLQSTNRKGKENPQPSRVYPDFPSFAESDEWEAKNQIPIDWEVYQAEREHPEVLKLKQENARLEAKLIEAEEAISAVKGIFLTPIAKRKVGEAWDEYHEDAWKRCHNFVPIHR